ncbi:MAG: hypothetical protein Q8O09_05415 [Bacillota bacterium]|nr:hypothetical protein [Bacillota bacterium]
MRCKARFNVIFLAIIYCVVLAIFTACSPVNLILQEYQTIKTDENFTDYTFVIISKKQELRREEYYNIEIKDDIDYSKYSLVLSINREIDEFVMNPSKHPSWYRPATEKSRNINICKPKYKDTVYEKTIFIYIVEKKDIVCNEEYEDTYF